MPIKFFDRYNILVIGNSGVGKSTLIREILNAKNIRDDVTTSISKKPYIKDGLPIALYDTPGLERENSQRHKIKQEIGKFIKKQKESNRQPHEHIHAIWFCINYQTTKESDIDQEWIAELAKRIPVILAVTRALSKEKTSLQRRLESNTNIYRIVPILIKEENTEAGIIKPFGLDNLIATTKQLFQEITQTAIQNAVNAKADKANAWLRDGCAKVLSAQMLAATISPLPLPSQLVEVSASFLQKLMMSDISTTFECKFESSFIKNLVTLSSGVPFISDWVEFAVTDSPLSDYHFETIKDILSYFITNLQQLAEALPFQEQLIEMLSSIANYKLIANLPILKGISALTVTLTTVLIGIAYIETLKIYKAAEYAGEPLPDIKDELVKQMKLIYKELKYFFTGGFGEQFSI